MKSKTVFLGCVIALAAAALAAAAMTSDRVRWRAEYLRYKIEGRMPDTGWLEVARDLVVPWRVAMKQDWVLGHYRLGRTGLEQPCPVLWTGPFGDFRGNPEDVHELEWYSRKHMNLGNDTQLGLVPRIDPGDTVLEIGGWIGVFTRFALRSGAARVIVFEPHPGSIECLKINFRDEIADGRVTIVEAAAWNEAGEVEMQREAPFNWHNSTKAYNVVEKGEIRVRAATIDEELRRLGVDRVDMINIDAEGAESEALAGASELLATQRPRIVSCLHHFPGDEEAVFEAVLAAQPEYKYRKNDMHVLFY